MKARIYADDMRVSHLQAKGRRQYLSLNIGPTVTESAGLSGLGQFIL